MADNVSITPGAGAAVATDDVGGVHYQRVKIALGSDGVAEGDVSSANPMPVVAVDELIETLQALRMAVQALSRSVGQSYPDVNGRLRVALDAITAGLTLATVTTVGTVTTVTTVATVSNQTNVGGYSAAPQVQAAMFGASETLRRNISVTP
jgi:hypothetical protein